MPNPGPIEHWRKRVLELYGQGEHGYLRIERLLEREPRPLVKGKPVEPPKRGAIATIINTTPNIEGYQAVSWPGSFGGPDLPWEAGAIVREMMRPGDVRPTFNHAIWFYRVSLAAPESSVQQRKRAAYWLSEAAQRGDSDDLFNRGQAIMRGDIASVLDAEYTAPLGPLNEFTAELSTEDLEVIAKSRWEEFE